MPSKIIKTPIEPGFVYHIYNRGNNFQNTFFEPEDYLLFLGGAKKYLTEYCSFYAFFILPNHYHFLIHINENLENNIFSRKFSNAILSYTNKINFRKNRNGSLFLSYFRRKRVDSEDYLKRVIFYIHYNPEKHKYIDNFKNYRYSSFNSFLSNKKTSISRNEVFDIYGGKEAFLEYHSYMHDESKIRKLIMEE